MGSEGPSLPFTNRLLQAAGRVCRRVSAVCRRRFWQRLTLHLKGLRQLATELLLIVLIVVAVVLLVEQVRTTSVRISVVAVPADLRANGFTEEAATELINSELEMIQQKSLVPNDGVLPWREEQAIHFTIPGAGFGLGELAREIKRMFNMSDPAIDVYIAKSDGQLGFKLRSSKVEMPVETHWRAGKSESEVVRLAAEEIARATQPIVIAAYYYSRNRLVDCRRVIADIHRAYPPRTAVRAKAYDLAGRILRDAGESDKSLVEFQKAREHDPSDAFVLTNTGEVLTSLGRYDDAIEVYRVAVEIDPRDAASLMYLSNALWFSGHSEESDEAYQQAMDVDSDDAIMLHNLSIALGTRGKWEEAAAASAKAMELDFRNPAISNGLGFALLNGKRPEEAVVAFQRTLEIDPEFVFAWANLCIVYTDLKHKDDARAACEKAKALAPENPRVNEMVDVQLKVVDAMK